MQPLDLSLPAELREQALAADKYAEEYIAKAKLGGEKMYKKVCKACPFEIQGCKFKGIVGEVTVKGNLKTIAKALLEYGCNVDAKSPKQILNSVLF